MAKFFDPPQAKPLLPKEKIDSVYKSMRFKVFMGSFLGYAAYYLVRKNLSLAAPDMIAEGLADKFGIGVAASALSIAYALSKFGMGMLSDRSDARKFLTVGLVVACDDVDGTSSVFGSKSWFQCSNAFCGDALRRCPFRNGMASLRTNDGILVLE